MCLCCCSVCGAICFNGARTKTLEIISIVFNSIAFFLIFLSLIIIKWKELSKANLVFFILMLLITTCCLVFAIFLRYWRAADLIKNNKKSIGASFAVATLVLVIIHFIMCLIEEIVFSISFYRANYPCYNMNDIYYDNYSYRRMGSNVDCSKESSSYFEENITFGQYFMAYVTFSYLEIYLILEMIICHILKIRIKLDLDGPQPINVPVQVPGQMVDPYGRAVVVVQPGDVVMMGGNQYQYNPYPQNIANQANYDNPNAQYPGSSDFQIQEKIS